MAIRYVSKQESANIIGRVKKFGWYKTPGGWYINPTETLGFLPNVKAAFNFPNELKLEDFKNGRLAKITKMPEGEVLWYSKERGIHKDMLRALLHVAGKQFVPGDIILSLLPDRNTILTLIRFAGSRYARFVLAPVMAEN